MKAKEHTYDLERVPLWKYLPLDTPFQFCIEPTFLCNIRCNYCMHALPRKTLENRGFCFAPMDWDVFEMTIEQLGEFPRKIKKVTFSGFGEPLLDKRLPKMIEAIRKRNIAEKILVISNGILLTPETGKALVEAGLSEFKISLQGLSAQKYKKICNVDMDYDEFYSNIACFYKNRGDCVLRIKVADSALDEGEEKEFYQKYGDICDYISVEHIYPQFDGVGYDGILLPDNSKNRFGVEYVEQSVCATLFFKLNILQSGVVTFGFPDGVTFDGFNVRNMTLTEIWNSRERNDFLRRHLEGNLELYPQCKSCTRWNYSFVENDSLNGHETEILNKMPPQTDISDLPKAKTLCYNGIVN